MHEDFKNQEPHFQFCVNNTTCTFSLKCSLVQIDCNVTLNVYPPSDNLLGIVEIIPTSTDPTKIEHGPAALPGPYRPPGTGGCLPGLPRPAAAPPPDRRPLREPGQLHREEEGTAGGGSVPPGQ